MPNKNRPLCLAPWTHAHYYNGQRKLCCYSTPPRENDKLKESNEDLFSFWNSPYMKEVRKKMLNGEFPEECQGCNVPDRTVQTYNKIFNQLYINEKDELLSRTSKEGELSLAPRYFDYRVNNECNFSCRMCNATASSSIRKIEQKAGVSSYIQQADSTQAKKEFLELVSQKKVERIYFADGEPFLSKFHWEIIERIKETQQESNISLIYNTNLSIINYKGDSIFDHLQNFKNITINASLDAIGKEGEFIRSGLKWSKWLSNYQKWKDFIGHQNIQVTITLTIPSILYIEKLADFIKEEKFNYTSFLSTAEGYETIWSPLALDNNTAKKIYDEKSKYLKHDASLKGLLESLELMRDTPKIQDYNPHWQEQVVESIKYNLQVDNYRPDRINTFEWYYEQKSIQEWFNNIMNLYFLRVKNIKTSPQLKGFTYPLVSSSPSKKFLDRSKSFVLYEQIELLEKIKKDLQAERNYQVVFYTSSDSLTNKLLAREKVKQKKEKLDRFLKSKSFKVEVKEKHYYPLRPEHIIKKKIPGKKIVFYMIQKLANAFPKIFSTQRMIIMDVIIN